jgi:hypothetical protein
VPIQAKESIHIKEKVKKAAKRHPSNFGAYTNPVTATRLIVEDILHLHGLSNSVKVKLAKSRVTKITELHHITIYGWQKNPDLAREIITHIKSKVKHPVRIDLLVKSVK